MALGRLLSGVAGFVGVCGDAFHVWVDATGGGLAESSVQDNCASSIW